MKAISELVELWGGLRRSSIWARGLLAHSLASLKHLKRARLKYKQEHRETGQAGGCRRHISSVETPVNTSKTHMPIRRESDWAAAACAGPHRQTTIYGELIRKWQRESEVGFCTDTSGIEISRSLSLPAASAFKFTFMSFEADFKSV